MSNFLSTRFSNLLFIGKLLTNIGIFRIAGVVLIYENSPISMIVGL